MKNYKTKWYFILLASALILSTEAYSSMFGGVVVKVYSDGKLVTTYKGKSGGRLVGACFVFEAASEIHEKTITVCGTFTVEEKK